MPNINGKYRTIDMKNSRAILFVFVTFAATSILGLSPAEAQVKTVPATDAVTTEQRETIEKIVKEYLLKNPTVIRDAMQALQAQEEKEKRELAAKTMKKLKSEIYADADSPVIGNPRGDVAIVVFFDYNCGYCRKSLTELQGLLDRDPMLRVIYKEFPILGPQSQVAATAALAAKRQGQYIAFNKALLEADGAGDAMIKGVSDKLKLNYAKLQQDMSDPKVGLEIERNIKLAAALDINGTPAYIVGDQIIPGAIDMTSLATMIAAERAKNTAPKAATATKD